MKGRDTGLLLRDLCARLPYRVKGKCELDKPYYSFDNMLQYPCFDAELVGIKNDGLYVRPLIEHVVGLESANKEVADGIGFDNFTPYLRPMSSMTEDERRLSEDAEEVHEWIEYLNSRHFDHYRKYDENDGEWKGMIELELALPSPEGMYNF